MDNVLQRFRQLLDSESGPGEIGSPGEGFSAHYYGKNSFSIGSICRGAGCSVKDSIAALLDAAIDQDIISFVECVEFLHVLFTTDTTVTIVEVLKELQVFFKAPDYPFLNAKERGLMEAYRLSGASPRSHTIMYIRIIRYCLHPALNYKQGVNEELLVASKTLGLLRKGNPLLYKRARMLVDHNLGRIRERSEFSVNTLLVN